MERWRENAWICPFEDIWVLRWQTEIKSHCGATYFCSPSQKWYCFDTISHITPLISHKRESLLFERLSSIRRDFLFVLSGLPVWEIRFHPLDVLFHGILSIGTVIPQRQSLILPFFEIRFLDLSSLHTGCIALVVFVVNRDFCPPYSGSHVMMISIQRAPLWRIMCMGSAAAAIYGDISPMDKVMVPAIIYARSRFVHRCFFFMISSILPPLAGGMIFCFLYLICT